MGKYRTYKNGIFGHKYKGFYIVKADPEARKSTFLVQDEQKNTIAKDLPDFHEAEWFIDMHTLTDADRAYVRALCGKEIFELSQALFDYMDLNRPLTAEENAKSIWIEKVRRRKSAHLPLLEG